MKRLSFCIVFILTVVVAHAQTLQEASTYFNEFKTAIQRNKVDAETFEWLLKSHQACLQVLLSEEKGSANYVEAKERLLGIFHHLGDAAFYFTELDDEKNVLKYARPYVEIALMRDFADQNFFADPNFPQFPMLLAHSAYARKNFQESIPYYNAYLQTGDMEYNEVAFVELADAFYHLKHYDEVVQVVVNAAKKYPRNWDLINLAIHACGLGKIDHDLQHLLDLGFQLKPRNLYMTEIQAALYERQRNYEEAVEVYAELNEMKPNLVTISSHLGIDYYNAGAQLMEELELLPREDDARIVHQKAQHLFRMAIPHLKDVLDNYPYAVNMMHALGMCYNILGDSVALKETNVLLAEQNVKQVKMGEKPLLELNYNPEVKTISVYNLKREDNSIVDLDIPEVLKPNSNKHTYAIIFGNENYKHVGKVAYAHNDAKSIAEYCRKMLGMPERNITLALDATKSEMEQYITKLQEQARMNPGEYKFIIYYAGHGLPDPIKGVSYLVPTDADGSDFQYCYSLNRLYDQLDKVDSKGVTVFMDACFSGGARNGGSVVSERYVFHGEQNAEVEGKTVAFSAASDIQTSLPYDEEHHGIFTYVLLKALKDSKGSITYGQLAETLKHEVDQIALDTKNKRQTPKVSTSDAMAEIWESVTLLK